MSIFQKHKFLDYKFVYAYLFDLKAQAINLVVT